MRFIIVPQAVRKVIPPLLNDFIALMKDTSLVSFLGLVEVVQAGQDIYFRDLQSIGPDAGSDHVPGGHDPAGEVRRRPDRATKREDPEGLNVAEERLFRS